MRLFKIQLSGFKSFVDPTTILISGNLVGIIGPNGCGKSNVIDAVRWVMGESSARNLRGDNMTDVIFNGTDLRKPVGRASVELIFDNSQGRSPGAYSSFSEISIKRTLTRDGVSQYLINNTKCRRRDITDMFRGTGLGHRSYSIIEQGMVSRIVEARPDDLRIFVEEAAGVSLYKDRRRETETRMRHTRENLARLEDIRSELGDHIRRLQRQSQAARRYQRLKVEEENVNAELLALKHRMQEDLVNQQKKYTADAQVSHDSIISKQRIIESSLEEILSRQLSAQATVSQMQGKIYALGADIATIEQSIEHSRETQHQQLGELERLKESLSELFKQKEEDNSSLNKIEYELAELIESQSTRKEALMDAEEQLVAREIDLERWQDAWEEFSRRASVPVQQKELERSKIEQLDSRDTSLQQRLARLDEEDETILQEEESLDIDAVRATISEHDRILADSHKRLEVEANKIDSIRNKSEQVKSQLDDRRRLLHEINGRLASLVDMQTAAFDADDKKSQDWFHSRGLSKAPRLADEVEVESGWERAADAVLSDRLAGLGVGQIDRVFSTDHGLPGMNLFLIEASSQATKDVTDDMLLSRLHSPRYDLSPWLAGVFVADTLEEAFVSREKLKQNECVVTRSGIVIGRNWVYARNAPNLHGGILSRGEEINQLEVKKSNYELEVNSFEQQRDILEKEFNLAEIRQGDEKKKIEEIQESLLGSRQLLVTKQARASQIRARSNQLRLESDELMQELTDVDVQLNDARRNLELAEDETGLLEKSRQSLLKKRDDLTEELTKRREVAHSRRDELHVGELDLQRLHVSVASIRSNIERLVVQSQRFDERQKQLEEALAGDEKPEINLNQKLEELLAEKDITEVEFSRSRQNYSDIEEAIRLERTKLSECEQELVVVRESLDNQRLMEKEQSVRLESINDQIKTTDYSLEEIIKNLPNEASEAQWVEKAESLASKIQQIGPVNLVAIEEFDEQSKRKDDLDQQHNDLLEALSTLEEVIKKIDRETRDTFKSTFDLLNEGFGEFFPKLFGGGKAILQLTDTDLLKSGVTVMAQPPGKRNSTIHLLSGGEKALTAVALLFALFRLNPAPFCVLDEVDAPLDDSNVERYCDTLKTLASRTQLIVITHNKITMESADVLLGVTMGEPGASAIVSVNVDEAVSMAGI